MSRRQRIVFKSAFVLLGGLVLIAVLVISATQTRVGQNQVRKLVMSFLSDNVQGKVYVGRIHGGLLSGLTIDSLEIRDKQDTLFVSTGPVRLKYDIRDLVDKRVLLRYVEIDHPVIYIRELPDGHWNWRKIFPERPHGPKSQARSFSDFIIIDSARVRNLTFTLTLRWHPADWFKGYRRDSVIAAALAHPTEEFRRAGKGYTRTWRFTEGDVTTSYVRLADPDSVGRSIRITDASMVVKDPPFRFSKVAANIRQNGDSIWFDAPRMSLPGSQGKAAGKLVWGSGLPLRYAIHVNTARVAMADIAWIYPTLPKTGSGSLDLEIVSEKNPHIIDYKITNMDVRTIKSRLLGSMTYAVGGEILGVKDVDVVADPVDFDLLRMLNGKPYPYDWQGKLTGTIVARGGPLTHFMVDKSDITFSDAHVPGAISKFRGRGELDILFPAFTAFHGFDVDMQKLDLRTLQYLNPLFPKLKGTLSGRARLDSSWLDVRFSQADILHHDADAPVSRVTGKGRVIWGEKFLTYDVDLQAQPLYLTTLARSYPVLPMRGELMGPIRIRGTSENLQIGTSMTGPSGAFTFDGYVDADPPAYGARGRGTVAGLDLKTLIVGKAIPETRLTGQYALEISGATAEELKGKIEADLEKSVVEGIPIERATGRFSIANGLAQIDTLRVRGTGLRGEASGSYAIAPVRSGSLKFDFSLDSIGAAKPYLRAAGIKIADADTLSGTLRMSGDMTGPPGRLITHAIIESEKFAFGGRGAGQLRADVAFGDSLTRNRVARISGSNVSFGGFVFGQGEAFASLDSAGTGSLSATLTSENGIKTELRGNSRMSGDTTFLQVDTLRIRGDVIGTYANEAPVHAQITSGGATLDSLILAHPTNGKLEIRGVRFVGDSIQASVRTEGVDLALISAFTPAIALARGSVRANVDVSGTTSQPKIEGEFRIDDGSATATAFGTRLEKINAQIDLTGDTVFVRRLSAETMRERLGRVAVEGFIGLKEYRKPIFSLSVNATNFHAIEKPGLASLDITTTSPLTLKGPFDGAVVTGAVRVDRGSIFIPDLVQKKIVDLSAPEFAEFADTLLVKDRKVLPSAPSEFAKNLSLENLALDLGPDVWLRSSEANIQLGGSLNVTQGGGGAQRAERTQLALEGTLNTIKGTYRLNLVDPFVQPTFDVESGTLRFFGTPDLNPSLDIKAIHTVRQARQSITGRDVRVRVNIGGTLAEPKLALDNPDNLPLSESDLLSYLITGEQGFALDNSRSQYGSQLASAAVRYGGTLLTNAIPRGLLDIVELQTPRLGSELYAPGSSDYYLALLNTRAILGKQIGQRWFLGLSTGFCVVNSANFVENLGLKLEYRFNAMYTVEGGIEPGTSDKTCTRSSVGTFQQTPSQRGFDFFRTWRF